MIVFSLPISLSQYPPLLALYKDDWRHVPRTGHSTEASVHYGCLGSGDENAGAQIPSLGMRVKLENVKKVEMADVSNNSEV